MRIIDNENKNSYIVQTFKYFFDKGIYLVLLNLIPAAMLSFFISPSSAVYYLFEYDFVNSISLSDLLFNFFDAPLRLWYIGLVGLFLLIITIAISFGVIDRHMRIGDFTVSPKIVFYRLNYNITTSFVSILVVFCCLELLNLFTILFYSLWAKIFSSFGMWLSLSIISFLITEFFKVYIISHLILWPPFMLHAGLTPINALKNAWSNMSGKIFKTVVSTFAVVVPIDIVMVLIAFFVGNTVLRLIFDAISYSLIIPLAIIVMYVIFYDVMGIDRMDLNKEKRIITRW